LVPNYRYRAIEQQWRIGLRRDPRRRRRAMSPQGSSGWAWCWSTTSRSRRAGRRAVPSASSTNPRPEDVTIFHPRSRFAARAGARINDGLELLAADRDFGRLRPVVADIRSRVIAGESFAEALARHEALFPAMYVALIRVGEASGSLDQVSKCSDERSRTRR